MSPELRSVFCQLALSLYIDHEPLNPVLVPKLSRVFKEENKSQIGLEE